MNILEMLDSFISGSKKEKSEKNITIQQKFIEFIEEFIVALNSNLSILEMKHQSDLEARKSFTREERRFIEKKYGDNSYEKCKKSFNKDLKVVEKLVEILKDNGLFVNDDLMLSAYIALANLFVGEQPSFESVSKNNIRANILACKEKNIHTRFIDCFDENCDLIEDKVYDFINVTKSLYNLIQIQTSIRVESYEDYRKLIVPNEVVMKCIDVVRERDREEFAKKREERISRNKSEREKKYEAANRPKIKINKSTKEYTELSKYMDVSSGELKKSVIDTIELSELLELLAEIPNITKSQLKRYTGDYLTLKIQKEIKNIMSKLSKENATFLKILLDEDNFEFYDELKEIILLNNYKDHDEELLNNVNALLNRYRSLLSTTNNGPSNLFILPNDLFMESELSIITSSNSDNIDSILKNIMQHFKMLESQSINDIRANVSDAFHKLKGEKNNILDNGMKAFRFGQKKSKLGLISIDVCSENKKTLQEIYHCQDNFNVILFYGVGSVLIEDEFDMYNRFWKNIETYYNRIDYIGKIFGEPFTPETLEIAKNLIDGSMNQINDNISKVEEKNLTLKLD